MNTQPPLLVPIDNPQLGFYDYTPYPSKHCPHCNTRKPKSDFSAHPTSKDGLQGYCDECNIPVARSNMQALRDGRGYSDIRHRFKADLYEWQRGKCKGCGHYEPHFRFFHLDRIIPGSRGGQYEWGNVQLLCLSCNAIKGKHHWEYLNQVNLRRGYITEPQSLHPILTHPLAQGRLIG